MLGNLPESSFKAVNDLYDDAVQPGAKQVGSAIETVAKALNLLLMPFKALSDVVDIKYKKFIEDFEQRVKTIPPEHITVPELATIGPALSDLRFSLDEEDIRSIYLNLLVQAVDDRNDRLNLRIFVQIVKQLSPFEARLWKHLFKNKENHPVATLRLLCIPSERHSFQKIFGQQWSTLVTDIVFEDASDELLDLSLQNFSRLGLIEFKQGHALSEERYSYITESKIYAEASNKLGTVSEIGSTLNRIEAEKHCFYMTSIGEAFLEICFS